LFSKSEEGMAVERKQGFADRLVDRYRKKSFVFWDYVILAVLLFLFVAAWGILTRASNVAISGPFYSKGYRAVYELDGEVAEALGSDTLELETVEADDETATIELKAGSRTERFVVDRKTARVLDGGKDTRAADGTELPLVFYYDAVREPDQVSATFGEDKDPEFSTEFTGLKGPVFARVKEKNPDNVVMWYHRSDGTSYGPQYSWELQLYDSDGKKVGTIVNDITSGVLLDARFYQDGWGSMNLAGTNYPTGLNRWAMFIGFNIILALWGVFHVLRARRHPAEWAAHWETFPLNFVGISRFYIRLMALTTFGFMGAGILTGDPKILLVTDLVGLVLMVYAVGAFAFPVLFNFIPWIAAILLFAPGRTMDYVQYPFGAQLYLVAVVGYLLYRYLSHRNRRKEIRAFAETLPPDARKAVLEGLEGAAVGEGAEGGAPAAT